MSVSRFCPKKWRMLALDIWGNGVFWRTLALEMGVWGCQDKA